MKVFVCGFLLAVAASASLLTEQHVTFQAFKVEHGKAYRNQAEETNRFKIYKDNVRSIEEHNALYEQGLVSYEKGVNQFTDMTDEEFWAMQTLRSSGKPDFNGPKHIKTGLALPDSIDWRTQGQVTEVKDQGTCLSCWAFSVAGSVEAAYKRKSGKLISLSEQQLVDCTTYINAGCGGGLLDTTFPYVVEKGLQSESSYPYIDKDGTCQFSSSDVVVKISDFKYTGVGDEDDLLDQVANIGPISSGLQCNYLKDYKSGIYEDKRCTNNYVNHGIVVIGYGSENGKDYWIVKNSYGPKWGEDGFFRIVRGVNECGIGNYSAYPIIN